MNQGALVADRQDAARKGAAFLVALEEAVDLREFALARGAVAQAARRTKKQRRSGVPAIAPPGH